MRVIVVCEESQRVALAFRRFGHDAYSCDIKPCTGGHPEWHLKGDCFGFLNGGFFVTESGQSVLVPGWDLMIAHPPCTYLTNVGNRHFSLDHNPAESVIGRWHLRNSAFAFVLRLMMADIPLIAIENPVGYLNSAFRPPDQIIDPYMFAKDKNDEWVTKRTCLWLKGLPPLLPCRFVRPDNKLLFGVSPSGKPYTWEERAVHGSTDRSRTFYGIADAMAMQWGSIRSRDSP